MIVNLSIFYNFIVYLLELFKFYLVDKYLYGWELKSRNWKKMTLTVIGLLGIALFFTYLSDEINPLFVYIPFILVETCIWFNGVFWELIISNLTTIYLISAIDMMIHGMYVIFVELISTSVQLPAELVTSITTIVFLEVISHAIRYKMQGYIRKIPIQYYVLFICLATGNNILLGEFKRIINKGNTAICIVYIFVVLGVFLEMALLLMLAATREVYKEKDLLNQKYLQWQENHYRYLEQRETTTKKFRHDIRNHIFLLQHLLEKGDLVEAKQYVNQMEEHCTATGTSISVNNGIVDAILNKYAAECKEKIIDLNVNGHVPPECNIPSFDLCVIFSNLLRNAIEATEKCEEKKIILELRQVDDMFMLSIKNTYDGKIKRKNGSIQTSKRDVELHGYGLSNIKECVERNQGYMEIQEQESYFIVQICLMV